MSNLSELNQVFIFFETGFKTVFFFVLLGYG